MMKWFGRLLRLLKSDNILIGLLQFFAISVLWAVIAIVFPLVITKAEFLLVFPASYLLSMLMVAIGGTVTFAWVFAGLQTWDLLERYKRSSLPPSDNDHQGGQKRLTAAMVKIEDLLRQAEDQFEKLDVYLNRVLYESWLLFSNPNPRSI